MGEGNEEGKEGSIPSEKGAEAPKSTNSSEDSLTPSLHSTFPFKKVWNPSTWLQSIHMLEQDAPRKKQQPLWMLEKRRKEGFIVLPQLLVQHCNTQQSPDRVSITIGNVLSSWFIISHSLFKIHWTHSSSLFYSLSLSLCTLSLYNLLPVTAVTCPETDGFSQVNDHELNGQVRMASV